MKHKWLVIQNSNNLLFLNERFYLLKETIQKSAPLLIFIQKFNYKISSFSVLNNFFYDLFNDPHSLNLSVNLTFLYEADFKENDSAEFENVIVKKLYLKRKKPIIEFANALKLFNYFFNKNLFYPHHTYDFYTLKTFKSALILIRPQKFVKRWEDSINFLFNIYYYRLKPLVFGNQLFKKETLALDWNAEIFDSISWRFYLPFFIDKKIQFDGSSNYFFSRISFYNVKFILVSDVNNQFKNIYFFKKNFLFTFGVINVFVDPWSVDYPFFLFSDSFVAQSFFFKLVVFLQKKAAYAHFVSLTRKAISYKVATRLYN